MHESGWVGPTPAGQLQGGRGPRFQGLVGFAKLRCKAPGYPGEKPWLRLVGPAGATDFVSPRPFIFFLTYRNMASSLSFSRSSAVAGARPMARPVARRARAPTRGPVRTVAGNSAEDGIFTPIVKVTRNIMGAKEFNKLRGKGISLHSQVITEFCKQIGADNKRKQGLIRQAKKNGEKLGFLS